MKILGKANVLLKAAPAYLVRSVLSHIASGYRKASFLTRALPLQLIELWSVRPDKIARLFSSPINATGVFAKASTIVAITHDRQESWPIRSKPTFAAVIFERANSSVLSAHLASLREKTVILGGTDSTFPVQSDVRFPPRTPLEVARLGEVTNLQTAFYVENLTSYQENLSPIPGGVLPHPWLGAVRLVRKTPPSRAAKKPVFCAHRTRKTSDQWETRRLVTKLAQGPWSDFVDIAAARLDLKTFRKQLSLHAFTLCVEGGGLDPSPKAFEALIHGSIPIIRESPLADAYRHLPVVVVSEWKEDALSRDFLAEELLRNRREWEDWSLVLERLSSNYWLELVKNQHRTRGNSSRLQR